MYEVLNENFKDMYPSIEKTLSDASFIAFDLEFSGLRSTSADTESLFDSPEERYDKLRSHIEPFIALQFGITTFSDVKTPQEFEAFDDKNVYQATTYNFNLMPKSIPTTNRKFSFQASTIEFLASNNFNFNTNMNNGISYLNEKDEQSLLKEINDNTLLRSMKKAVTYKEEEDLRDCKYKIYEWLLCQKDLSLRIPTPNSVINYVIHKDIRHSFPNLWTLSGDNCIHVIRTNKTVRSKLETEEGSILEHACLDQYVGFSKVFKLLVKLQKPMIGHNVLLDLMFMYQQFYRPLPQKYQHFKESIHQLFPVIYDTKCMALQFRQVFQANEQWKSSSLDGLYQYFERRVEKHPSFNLKFEITGCRPADVKAKAALHHAGYDSYFTGYIFLKMLHLFAIKKYGQGMKLKAVTNTELFSCVRERLNCIHFHRGNILYLKLDGLDDKTVRAPLLCVRILNPGISVHQIAEQFSVFGSVDVRRLSQKHAVVAVGLPKTANDILRRFHRSNEFRVYCSSTSGFSYPKLSLWSGFLISSGMLMWMWGRQVTSHLLKRT